MSEHYRDVRDGLHAIKPTQTRPSEPAMPPSAPSGVGGMNPTQVARRSLEAHQRAAQALEDIREIMRPALESLPPVIVQLAEGLAPILAQAAGDLRAMSEALVKSLEYSPLDAHED